MALVDEVQARYSAAFLKSLTNPDVQAPVAIDAARLAAASTDAQAEFDRETGLAFDLTVPNHVELCVRGVVLKLQVYRGLTFQEIRAEEDLWREELRRYARRAGGLRWITPTTDSTIAQTPDSTDPRATPAFDAPNLETYRARRPAAISDPTDPEIGRI